MSAPTPCLCAYCRDEETAESTSTDERIDRLTDAIQTLTKTIALERAYTMSTGPCRECGEPATTWDPQEQSLCDAHRTERSDDLKTAKVVRRFVVIANGKS